MTKFVAQKLCWKMDRLITDKALLQFIFGAGQGIRVSEEQPGFDELAAPSSPPFR